jgi:glutaredoxin
LTSNKVIVYSKDGCHLCERAISKLEELSKSFTFDLQIVEITKNNETFAKFYLEIPVVILDGEVVFQASDIDTPTAIERKLEVMFRDKTG